MKTDIYIRQSMQSHKEVIDFAKQFQANMVVGVIGSVSNGKSTIVKSITGLVTQRHAKEKQTNRTIRVGYANAKMYKCPNCPAPGSYKSIKSNETECICEECNSVCELQTHISFTDVPGHNLFMATMLNGTCAMDCAIMIESCMNEQFPSQQTIEHYEILRKKGIRTVLVCLNKVDLMAKTPKKVKQKMEILRKFIFDAEGIVVPVIPVSGTMNCNIDIIREYLCRVQIPEKDIVSNPKLFAIRSFNVNLPKTQLNEIKGGVVGGCLQRGILTVGDELILSPGYTEKQTQLEIEQTGINWKYTPINCKILSIDSERIELNYAIPGGLIGVQLDIDPAMTGNDGTVGHMLFKPCEIAKFKTYEGIKLEYTKIRDHELKVGDELQININANNVMCTIHDIYDKFIELDLINAICAEDGDLVTLSIITNKTSINIVGSGTIVGGIESLCTI